MRPDVGGGVFGVEAAEGGDQHEAVYQAAGHCRHFSGQGAADGTAHQVNGLFCIKTLNRLHRVDDPIEQAVQMAEVLVAWEARQRRHHDAACRRQFVEERQPFWHAADAGEEHRGRNAGIVSRFQNPNRLAADGE